MKCKGDSSWEEAPASLGQRPHRQAAGFTGRSQGTQFHLNSTDSERKRECSQVCGCLKGPRPEGNLLCTNINLSFNSNFPQMFLVYLHLSKRTAYFFFFFFWKALHREGETQRPPTCWFTPQMFMEIRPKLGARSLIRVSRVSAGWGGGGPDLGPSSTALPGHQQGAGFASEDNGAVSTLVRILLFPGN